MKVDVRDKKRVYDGFFKIDRALVSYDGEQGRVENAPLEVFERGDSAAAILHHRKRSEIILTEQFRFPTYEKGPGWLLEVAAGSVDPGETPEQCIRREVGEELGYEIQDLRFVSRFYTSPGGSSERVHLYYCVVADGDLKDPGAHGNAGAHEHVTKVIWRTEDFCAAGENGQFEDAKSIIAALWLGQALSVGLI